MLYRIEGLEMCLSSLPDALWLACSDATQYVTILSTLKSLIGREINGWRQQHKILLQYSELSSLIQGGRSMAGTPTIVTLLRVLKSHTDREISGWDTNHCYNTQSSQVSYREGDQWLGHQPFSYSTQSSQVLYQEGDQSLGHQPFLQYSKLSSLIPWGWSVIGTPTIVTILRALKSHAGKENGGWDTTIVDKPYSELSSLIPTGRSVAGTTTIIRMLRALKSHTDREISRWVTNHCYNTYYCY